jgi:hypothetical protein
MLACYSWNTLLDLAGCCPVSINIQGLATDRHVFQPEKAYSPVQPFNLNYCNVLGVLFMRELYCTPKSQYTTVKHSQKLIEHTYTSDLYGPGALIPTGYFQQDLLWRSSNAHPHSCSHKASKHTSGQSIVGLSVHLHFGV